MSSLRSSQNSRTPRAQLATFPPNRARFSSWAPGPPPHHHAHAHAPAALLGPLSFLWSVSSLRLCSLTLAQTQVRAAGCPASFSPCRPFPMPRPKGLPAVPPRPQPARPCPAPSFLPPRPRHHFTPQRSVHSPVSPAGLRSLARKGCLRVPRTLNLIHSSCSAPMQGRRREEDGGKRKKK